MEKINKPTKVVVEEEEIVIVGGGIAGLATALGLKRVGFHSRVLECNSELRTTGAALTLFPNAWFALRALGVEHKLTSIYQIFRKSQITNLENGVTHEFSFAGTKERSGVMTVHRKVLLQALAEELPLDTIRFSSKVISIKKDNQEDSSETTALYLDDGTIIKAKIVIGCDGIHSTVAQWLGLSQPMNSGRVAIRGLSVFPEGHEFKQQARQYLGRGMRAAFIPLNSNDLYWFLVTNSVDKGMSTNPEEILKEVTNNLAKDFPSDFLAVAERSDMSTLTSASLLFRAPWNVAFGRTRMGNVTVAGDAMHPMTPEIGQGGCSALEDAVILARCLSRARADSNSQLPEEGLKRYVEERRWRVTWLVAGAWFSGRMQHIGGSGGEWWSGATRWFRDRVFYKIIFPRIVDSIWFDCGDLLDPAK